MPEMRGALRIRQDGGRCPEMLEWLHRQRRLSMMVKLTAYTPNPDLVCDMAARTYY